MWKHGDHGLIRDTIPVFTWKDWTKLRRTSVSIAGMWFRFGTRALPITSKCALLIRPRISLVESSWTVMAHGDAREGKWRGNWRMEWVASTLYTTSERGVSSITTADAHTSAASSRLNWRPRRFKWTRPFRRKTKYGFCACAITFQTQSTTVPSTEH